MKNKILFSGALNIRSMVDEIKIVSWLWILGKKTYQLVMFTKIGCVNRWSINIICNFPLNYYSTFVIDWNTPYTPHSFHLLIKEVYDYK